MHIQISLGNKYLLKLTIYLFIYLFLTESAPLKHFTSKSWTPSLNFAYWNPCRYPGFPIRSRFVLAKFLLKLTVLVFWTKFAPPQHFQSKSWTPSLNSTYWNLSSYTGFHMRDWLVRALPRTPSPTLAKTLVLNFSWNWQFNFLGTSALNSAY